MNVVSGSMRRISNNSSFLSKEEELELLKNWKEKSCERSLDKLIRSHLRLVISITNRFKNYGLVQEDLVQEGCAGLVNAANRFDPTKDSRFSTYAIWWIKASIQTYVLKNWSLVKNGNSTDQKKLFFHFNKLKVKLLRENPKLGNEELLTRISEYLNISKSLVRETSLRIGVADISLNVMLQGSEEDSAEHQDFLIDPNPLQDEVVEKLIDGNREFTGIYTALNKLSDRERDIIHCRYLSEDRQTLDDLGVKYNISKERIRQLESRALKRLKFDADLKRLNAMMT